ncbi:MAG TPA: glycosyltransferase family 4 protein [Afifellaceae bacterium]|nr:glycosyltransferase family 4 protein [Afifellaceae bacterium]
MLQAIPALGSGGAELTALELAGGLVRRGHRTLVAAARGRMAAAWNAAGAAHFDLPLDSRSPARILANARALAGIIRADNVDLVHARSRAPAWSAWLACRSTGTPFVTTYHGAYSERGPLKRLYNSVMARGAAVIAPSAYIAGLIAERYRLPPERIAIVHDGIDLATFAPDAVAAKRRARLARLWGLPDSARIVLAAARLTPIKGQRVLVEAMARPALSSPPDVALVLAGGDDGHGGYRAKLERLARAYGLEGRVRLVGHCDDVPAALALADVAVQPSLVPEAFGRGAVEAQAMGLPTIVTALGAAPEVVLAPPGVASAERTGWHVPPDDSDALAAAVAEALDLPDGERSALGRRARAHAAQFSQDAMVEGTLAVYRRVLADNGAPQREPTSGLS